MIKTFNIYICKYAYKHIFSTFKKFLNSKIIHVFLNKSPSAHQVQQNNNILKYLFYSIQNSCFPY